MTYKPLAEIARRRVADQRTELSKPLRGAGRLPSGWHSVVVAAVDTARVSDRGTITLTLEVGDIHHKQSIWLLSYDKESISVEFDHIIAALFDDAVDEYIDLLSGEHQLEALHMLRGLRLDVEIQPGPGYIIDRTPDGYIAVDAKTDEPITPPQLEVRQTRTLAEARGYKRSYTKVTNATSTHAEKNCESLRNAATAIVDAAETNYTHATDS